MVGKRHGSAWLLAQHYPFVVTSILTVLSQMVNGSASTSDTVPGKRVCIAKVTGISFDVQCIRDQAEFAQGWETNGSVSVTVFH